MRCTLGEFLVRRLKEAGVEHVFGVPGDFVLGILNHVLESDLIYTGTCNELNAAYAADACARVQGIACVMTTYAVGELSALNGIAGSFAEGVPVIKVVGAPSKRFFETQPLLHHTLGDYDIPLEIYKKVTSAHAVIKNLDTAVQEIDRVLTVCVTRKSPVYLAVCTDLVAEFIDVPAAPLEIIPAKSSHRDTLKEAVEEIAYSLENSEMPIFVPGVELLRFGFVAEFEALVAKTGIPFATMMLGKSIIDEEHPLFIGLYSGARSREYVRKRVEGSDCVILFGVRLTDFNTGGFTMELSRKNTITVAVDNVQVSHHKYHEVFIGECLRSLTERLGPRDPSTLDVIPATVGCIHRRTTAYIPKPTALTMCRFFDRMSTFLLPNSVVIAETGASLFSAAETLMPKSTLFIGQTFYGSIGYSVGATLGASLGAPNKRVVSFIGDGSFQVTASDISTMIRRKCKPLIFLLNNDGYTIERVIVDRSYNDIQMWSYTKIPLVMGGIEGVTARTEEELETALEEAKKHEDEVFMIEVILDRWDCNETLRKAGISMALNNNLLREEELMQAHIKLSTDSGGHRSPKSNEN